MKSRINKRILLGCVFLHLALVTVSGFYIQIADWVPGKKIIDIYKRLSGSGSTYGFFAPAIGLKAQGLFDIIDDNGATIASVPLVPASEREVEIRVTGIFDGFTSKEGQDERLRKPIARSLAAVVFSKYADAAEVVLRIREFSPITMEQYRKGQQETWAELYTARFARNSKGGSHDHN